MASCAIKRENEATTSVPALFCAVGGQKITSPRLQFAVEDAINGLCRGRTCDLPIKSRLLYQLS